MSDEIPDHEHDDEGNCIVPEPQEHPLFPGGLPTWKWSTWDLAGAVVATTAGVCMSLGQGLNIIARECNAMANWTRNQYDAMAEELREEEARREMAESYERLTGIGTLWVQEEQDQP